MCVEPHCLSGGDATVSGGWVSIACSPGDLYQLWAGVPEPASCLGSYPNLLVSPVSVKSPWKW